MMRTGNEMSYDPRCYDLAAMFLEDEPRLFNEKHNDALAQLIQSTIEDYIAYERDALEGSEEDPNNTFRDAVTPFAESH